MATREAFLARVRGGLARTDGAAASPAAAPPTPAPPGTAAPREGAGPEWPALLARFRQEAERVGTVCHRAATLADATALVLGLARERGAGRVAAWARGPLGPAAGVSAGLAAAGLEVLEAAAEERSAAERAGARDFLARADLGLTTADLVIAATGSLVLVSGPGRPRAVSLLPPCHVAVFGRGALVPGLEEAAVALQAWQGGPPGEGGSNVVFVTGPSRTADIELTLTRGVHGPKEVHAVLVEAP
jgi:L-lactate utilization protein LutC